MDSTFDRLSRALAGRYRLERELGAGSGGKVFLADDLRHSRKVAIKILDPELAAAIGPDRFLREIRISARLMHPHILPLLDSGTVDGLTYFVMAYASAGTLRDRLRECAQLPVEEVVRIAGEIADALDSAHRHGIVHRDVKPENILFEDGHALLADFGIARALAGDDAAPMTLPAMALGTPGYMSPEQISTGEPVTAASDQYSLACALFEMLGGRLPFPGATSTSILQQHLTAAVPNVRDLRTGVHPDLAGAIQRAMAKTPGDRFPNVSEFRAAITAAALALGAGETVPVARSNKLRPTSAHRLRRALAAAVVLFALASAALLMRQPRRPAGPLVRSLAVLPLTNVSGDSKEQYYADGMTEELILELSKISALRVISRTSVMSLKGKELSLAEIGHRLGVDAVLEGTIARGDNRLRVNLQLFQVEPEHQLWGERYDRPADKALELQTEIARAVVGPVRVQMTPAEAVRLVSTRPVSPEAHEAYLRGRFSMAQTDAVHLREALNQFNAAVARDPEYASAWASLAQTYYLMSNIYLPPAFAMERARSAASRAIALDPNLASAHAAMGAVLGQYDWKFADAEHEYREGIRLDPSDSDCHYYLGYILLETGRIPEAQREFEIARSQDPLSAFRANFAAYGFYCARNYPEAERRYRELIASNREDIMPRYSLALIALARGRTNEAIAGLEPLVHDADQTLPIALLGYAYGRAGRRTDAERILALLRVKQSDFHVRPTDFALVYVGMGERERAMEWFERACADRDENFLSMTADPILDPIRTDERFRALVRRLGINPT